MDSSQIKFRVRPPSKNLQRREVTTVSDKQLNLEKQIYTIEINNKLHQLQSALISMKNTFDMRFSKISDPKIQIKGILDREQNKNNQLSNKINQLEQGLQYIKQSIKKSNESSNNVLLQIQKRLQITQYKSKSLQKELEGAKNIKILSLSNPSNNQPPNSQLKVLRQIIYHQKLNRQHLQSTFNRQFQQLKESNIKLQQDLYNLLNKQQLEKFDEIKNKREEDQMIQRQKKQIIGMQYNSVKGMIGSIQKKIQNEINQKNRNDNQLKQYVDYKVDRLREELILEQKNLVNQETKFMKETKQSIQSLYNILIVTKQNLQQNLTATQVLSIENIKNLSKSIDFIKDTFDKKFQNYLQSKTDSSGKVQQLKSKVIQTLKLTDQRIKEIQQNHQMNLQKFEKSNAFVFQQFSKKMEDYQLNLNNWKSDVEKKNLNIFKQISTTLKTLKSEATKQKQQSNVKFTNLKRQNQSIQKGLSSELKKYIESIISVFNNEFEVVVGELEILMEMINMSRNQTEKLLISKLQKTKQQIKQENQASLNMKSKQLTTSFQKSISKLQENLRLKQEKQFKYMSQVINQKDITLSTQLSILNNTMKQTVLKIETDLNANTQKYNKFIKQYRQDLKTLQNNQAKQRNKLEQAIKNNTTLMIQTATKRNQFIIEGIRKAIELNAIKDKTQMIGELEKVKDEAIRNLNTLKYELTTQVYSRLQNQRSQRIEQQQILNSTIENTETNLRKSLNIEISNLKLLYDQQLKRMQNKLLELTIQLNNKINSINNNISQFNIKTQTYLYVRELQSNLVFQQLSSDINTVKQQSAYCFKQIKKISKIQNTIDNIESQFYEMDQKISKQIESSAINLANQMYLDHNFNKAQFQQHQNTLIQVLSLIQNLNKQLTDITQDIQDTESRFTQNFQIVQKAFKHHNLFLNQLDTRLTIEEIYAKLSQNDIIQRINSIQNNKSNQIKSDMQV